MRRAETPHPRLRPTSPPHHEGTGRNQERDRESNDGTPGRPAARARRCRLVGRATRTHPRCGDGRDLGRLPRGPAESLARGVDGDQPQLRQQSPEPAAGDPVRPRQLHRPAHPVQHFRFRWRQPSEQRLVRHQLFGLRHPSVQQYHREQRHRWSIHSAPSSARTSPMRSSISAWR